MANMTRHEKFMQMAIKLAEKGEGRVSPNPLVGAVIVKSGKVIGRGWHEYFGGRHAEVNAIRQAGTRAMGATLYVTLEPCNHYGKQPPCTQAVIAAGIKEVFVAMEDPNPASKHGAMELRGKGVKVHIGGCRKEAKKQNEFYIRSLHSERPFITIKAAMTQDGFISYGNRKAKRISSKGAMRFAQELRMKYDAVLVGVNTVINDDPRLTYHKNPALNPVRIVLDPHLRTPASSRILSQRGLAIIVCSKGADRKKIKRLEEKGALLLRVAEKGKIDLARLLRRLYGLGIRSVLVEGGSKTSTAFLERGLFDRAYLIVSGKEVKNGLKAFALKKSIEMRVIEKKTLGRDLLFTMEKMAGVGP